MVFLTHGIHYLGTFGAAAVSGCQQLSGLLTAVSSCQRLSGLSGRVAKIGFSQLLGSRGHLAAERLPTAAERLPTAAERLAAERLLTAVKRMPTLCREAAGHSPCHMRNQHIFVRKTSTRTTYGRQSP